MWFKHSIPSNVRLWLTKPYGGVQGFYAWAQHPERQRELGLMAAIGFSVDSGNDSWNTFVVHQLIVSLTFSECPLSSTFLSRPFEPDSGSIGYLEKVSNWVKECHDSHQECPKEPPPLPTRILDVCVDGDAIKLVDGLCETGLYACLSYCVSIFSFCIPSVVPTAYSSNTLFFYLQISGDTAIRSPPPRNLWRHARPASPYLRYRKPLSMRSSLLGIYA